MTANHWENPRIFNINKERPHASATYYPDLEAAFLGKIRPGINRSTGSGSSTGSSALLTAPKIFTNPDMMSPVGMRSLSRRSGSCRDTAHRIIWLMAG